VAHIYTAVTDDVDFGETLVMVRHEVTDCALKHDRIKHSDTVPLPVCLLCRSGDMKARSGPCIARQGPDGSIRNGRRCFAVLTHLVRVQGHEPQQAGTEGRSITGRAKYARIDVAGRTE
jgi:hypothetical protein